MQLLKVTQDADPAVLGRAIGNIVHADDTPVLSAITVEAKARALDAIVTADRLRAASDRALACALDYEELELDGRHRTAVIFRLSAAEHPSWK